MKVLRVITLAALLLCQTTAQIWAQQQDGRNSDTVLVADSVFVTGEDVLTAQGNVEIWQDGVRIQASKIEYNSTLDRVVIHGPIRMTQGDDVTILAGFADLDASFQNGIMRSARVVLERRVQMATHQLNRIDGRYNVLNKASVTACRVCASGEAPLWQIRASRVIHDQEARQIYMDNAQFRVLDVPVFYLPKLRLPDPTQNRATGFLIPQARNDSNLGWGLKWPYFITMGDHRDLTLTPYISSRTRTLEYRYRQAFKQGRIQVEGAISNDTLGAGNPRAYLFADGHLDLPRDYRLTFDVKATSDDSYLFQYGYSTTDRLDSDISVRRASRDENTRFGLLHYESLRDSEDNSRIPRVVLVAETERRIFPSFLGGETRLNLEAHGHMRTSTTNVDGSDPDGIVDGRDVARANATLWWRRNFTHTSGLRYGVTGQLAFDMVRSEQDANVSEFAHQVSPSIAAHLRYPFSKMTASGATHILEPVAQIAWTGGKTLNVANDESTRVEFDEGNLIALSRFPSEDRRERDFSTVYGMNWSRFASGGWSSRLTFGQVLRSADQPSFTQSSGLTGTRSDFLLAGQIKTRNGLSLTARGLFDGTQGINKAAARGSWKSQVLDMGLTYVWLGPDISEARATTLSEVAFDGDYRMARHWTGKLDWRYDVANRGFAEAAFGVEYRNECVQIDFRVSRRFAVSSSLQPSTTVGFTVALLGFSVNDADRSYDRTCEQKSG